MRLTQPFGVNYLGGDFYSKVGIPSGLHTGWDLSCVSGTPVYAVADGWCEVEKDSGYGVNARLFIEDYVDSQLEVVHAHLQEVIKTGEVKMGYQIAISDNTGYSTGPHLHWGIRKRIRSGSGWQVLNHDNGFFGYLDPAQFFPKSGFDLPVDRQYGLTVYTPGVPSEWYILVNARIPVWKQFRRLLTVREANALRFGFWDLRAVLEPAMFPIWSEITKMEAQKRGLVK